MSQTMHALTMEILKSKLLKILNTVLNQKNFVNYL